MQIIITTSHKPHPQQVIKAKTLAEQVGGKYILRRHFHFIPKETVLIVEKDGISAIKDDQKLFFHPSLAVLRKANIESDQDDHLIDSLKLNGNESVLDCTLGLGSEAILISHFLPFGSVTCLESSKIVKLIVEDGMRSITDIPEWVKDAISRIKIIEGDYKSFVRRSDEKFDCVYADPMFEHPGYDSISMNKLRPFADHSTIEVEDIEFMKRIARKRIVIKAKWNDSIFEKYKFDSVTGSFKSNIGYGVVEL